MRAGLSRSQDRPPITLPAARSQSPFSTQLMPIKHFRNLRRSENPIRAFCGQQSGLIVPFSIEFDLFSGARKIGPDKVLYTGSDWQSGLDLAGRSVTPFTHLMGYFTVGDPCIRGEAETPGGDARAPLRCFRSSRGSSTFCNHQHMLRSPPMGDGIEHWGCAHVVAKVHTDSYNPSAGRRHWRAQRDAEVQLHTHLPWQRCHRQSISRP